MRRFQPPPVWSEGQLESDRRAAIESFIRTRTGEGIERYRLAFAESLALVTQLLEATRDLTDLEDSAAAVWPGPLSRAARYLAGPPISNDDLQTLASATSSEGASRPHPNALARVIAMALDIERFPWLGEHSGRDPTRNERELALRWTAGLMAAQDVQRWRRQESSVRQEAAVKSLLKGLGFTPVPRREIDVTGGLAAGEFSSECLVVGKKCDIPVGLRDRRLMLIECKVSNSFVNSVKRLNREVAGKAQDWRRALGERAVPVAVLSGVYKLHNLRDAQAAGVGIFWEHDLGPLGQFLSAAA